MRGEVVWERKVGEDISVIVLHYGEPHNCHRVEIVSNDLNGDLSNMETTLALDLANALCGAATFGPI